MNTVLHERGPRYGRAALAREVEALADPDFISPQRQLFTASVKIGSLVAGGEIAHDHAIAALSAAARLLDVSESKARRTITRGMAAGAKNPRRAPPGHRVADREEVILVVLDTYRHALATGDWRGQAGATRLCILTAFVLLAMRRGDWTWT